MNQEKIGLFIKERRKELGLTQEQLAEKLNVSNRAISKWENGKCIPDLSLFEPLCKELKIDIIELINGEKSKENINMNESIFNIINVLIKRYKKYIFEVIKLLLISFIILLFVSLALIYYFLIYKEEKIYITEEEYSYKICNEGEYPYLYIYMNDGYAFHTFLEGNNMDVNYKIYRPRKYLNDLTNINYITSENNKFLIVKTYTIYINSKLVYTPGMEIQKCDN